MNDVNRPDPPLWERLAPQDIPACSTTQIVGLGILPGFLLTFSVTIGAWYLVLSGTANEVHMALQAEHLQSVAPAAGSTSQTR